MLVLKKIENIDSTYLNGTNIDFLIDKASNVFSNLFSNSNFLFTLNIGKVTANKTYVKPKRLVTLTLKVVLSKRIAMRKSTNFLSEITDLSLLFASKSIIK